MSDSRAFRSPPGTLEGAGGASLCRNDMSELFEQFRILLQLVRDSIVPAVQAAILPVQAQVSDIADRLEKLERLAGSGNEAWAVWHNYHNYDDDGYNVDQDYGSEYVPIEPTWAERAAKAAKSPGGKGPGGKGPGGRLTEGLRFQRFLYLSCKHNI